MVANPIFRSIIERAQAAKAKLAPVKPIYQQTTVKPTSSARSVQAAVTKTAKVPAVTLGGQITHATSPALSTQERLPGGSMLGALPAPVSKGLGGSVGGFPVKWLVIAAVVVIIIVAVRR